MGRVSSPVISVATILGMRPGETIVLTGVSEKEKSSIYTMVNYVKEHKMLHKHNISAYTCRYDASARECSVTAIPRGFNRKSWEEHLKQEENDTK